MIVVLAALFSLRDPHREFGEVGEELVQRRIEKANGHGQAVHFADHLEEVAALKG